MNLLKQIICVWLFYVVNGMILVGLVKVKIQSTVREKNASKRDNRFTRDSTQTGSWSGTISQTIFIRKNVIQMNLPKQLLARRIVFVNRISVTRGLCILLDENPVGWQLLQILHSVLSVSVVIFFSVQVGGKIKLLVENLFTSLPILRKHYSNKAPNSMVMSLLFLILGLILRIPLWNLYLIGLADQEEQILEKISHQAILRNNTSVYYFINMDWLLVLHFSSVNISFLLSFSYFFTTVIEEFKQRYMSLQMNSQLCDSNISCIV